MKVTAPINLPKARVASKPKNQGTLSYTQSEVVENVKNFCGFPKRIQAKELIEDIRLFIVDSLKRGYKIPFFGLGKMYVRHSKPSIKRNPMTGEMINVPARKRIRFSASKALKQAVI